MDINLANIKLKNKNKWQTADIFQQISKYRMEYTALL